MSVTYSEINDVVLNPLRAPRPMYFAAVGFLGMLLTWMFLCWFYQIELGLGVAGINQPVGWATYITNFVFWVGIAHSGTLISAILYLARSRWRTAVARSAEAMTIFAIMTAGLFPLIHLGRVWVAFFILPYPSERQLWPNFISPLVWDVVAVSTYFTVSLIFWYVGMLPDLASARDRCIMALGPKHLRTRLYHLLALGWHGAGNQWRHHGRAYLFFAALATPLVVSVHSVVSWDFAMGILPGWHTTIFAPYFVAGAIHSGLAMVLTLLIPMRRLLKLDKLVKIQHFESVAQTMIVTGLIVGYAYAIEPFISWYSGDLYEQQFTWWRDMDSNWAIIFWVITACNVAIPLTFLFRWVRRNLVTLFLVSIFVNIGMWFERLWIIGGATAHDFLPHNWGNYLPTWVEVSITVGSFAWFFFWFFVFSRMLPTIAMSDVKEEEWRDEKDKPEIDLNPKCGPARRTAQSGVMAVFKDPKSFLTGIRALQERGYSRIETYTPLRLREAEKLLGRGPSPVRYWTLIGALSGCAGGFGLAIYAATVNSLVVGGKPPVSLVPYCVVGFEGTILLGTIFNFLGVMLHSRLGSPKLPKGYDGRFTSNRFGVFLDNRPGALPAIKDALAATGVEDVHVVE